MPLHRNVFGSWFLLMLTVALLLPPSASAQRTVKPVLHGRHWVAITGKPLGATAGAMMFQKGGNAVDAACAMLGATATMWDVLSRGGETSPFKVITGGCKLGIRLSPTQPTQPCSARFSNPSSKKAPSP